MIMKETPEKEIVQKILELNLHFKKGKTLSINDRLRLLKKFRKVILSRQDEVCDALYKDLRKSRQEGYISEVAQVVNEINIHIKKLRKWTKTKRVKTPLFLLPSSSYLKHEPRGTVLIIAPWNYPFQLLLTPLVGAISAGNTAMLKPSEFCTNTNKVMNLIVQEVFQKEHVSMVHGGKETNQTLFKQRFDLIYFTGSPFLGKIVMQAAAQNLTPVVLELGGKSPCIVDETADIKVAAKRIAWGKTLNLGQTCIAPDYVLVKRSVQKPLQEAIIQYWKEFYGEDPQQSEYLPRMVHEDAFDRITSYFENGKILHGGHVDRNDKFIGPTLLGEVDLNSPVMQDEIFGPVLPIIPFDTLEEAIELIHSKEKPLAYYYFGKQKTAKKLLEANTSGGVCINDAIIHISNHNLPFGGVGHSGIGSCHGWYSFEAFSNPRAIMKTPTWLDLPFRYPPFKNYRLTKKLLS